MPKTETGMTEAYEWRGRTAVDPDGEKIGKIDEIYLDQETRKPEWALVSTGRFGTKSNFVPLAGATPAGEDVQLAFPKDAVKDAPGIEPEGELSQQEEKTLYGHYGLHYSESRSDSGLPEGEAGGKRKKGGAKGKKGGAKGKKGASGDQAMTRSEEELNVGTAKTERGRARLVKYVETEEVQKTVPVRREKARIEREPVTEANRGDAMSGPEITEAEHEVVLHEEEPVVEKRTVPKERVRLEKDVETEEEQVSEDVRKERIETEGDLES